MTWRLVTAPTAEPVSVDEVRLQERISYVDESSVLIGYIAAARAHIEGYTSRALMTQTWRVTMPWFADRIWLPRAAPLQADSVAITYYDSSNVLQSLDASRYLVHEDGEPASLGLAPNQQWPTTIGRIDAVRIAYDCGWSAADDVPAPLRQAVAILAAHWYLNREATTTESMSDVPFGVEALCAPFRVGAREYAISA